MASLLVIGELGEVLRMESPADLKKCVDLYNRKMNLEQNDIYLLDKNGRTIYFNAMHEVNYDSKFFIFNKTFYKDRLVKIFEENVDKISNVYTSNTNLNYLPSNLNISLNNDYFSALNELVSVNTSNPNSKLFDKNSTSPSELKKLSETLIESFENAKAIFKSLKINVKICEKIRDNYNYQYNSLECIYKNISVLYEQCFNKYKELELDLGKMNEKNDKTLQVFRDSIDRLKTYELHPKMQGPKEKNLIDIYFDESKMNVWKEKCVKSSDFITKKIKSKGELILNEKVKIRNEKNTNILQLKNDWNNIIGEYENFINEKEALGTSILSTISEDLKSFQKNISILQDLIANNNVANIDEVFQTINAIKTKIYSNYKELIPMLQQYSTSIEDFSKKMKNLLVKSSVQINVVFSNYHLIKKNLLEIMEKVEKYSQGLVNLEKDFSYLANPSYFPQAYQASIIEIKRRIIFNKKIMKDFERLKQLIVKENLNRKQFIQDYGKYLTHDYVPQLKFSDLKLNIDFNNNEEMTNLPNLLDEEEEATINNHNVVLEYDDVVSQSQDNLMLGRLGVNSSGYTNISSVRKNSETERENLQKKFASNPEFEEAVRNLNAKISELEIVISVKENEIKKIMSKLDQKDRKITFMQSETEKLAQTIESLSENFLKQLTYKDQKIKEKTQECENILSNKNFQNGNKLDNCPMCKDILTNSIEYQGWSNFVKDYHEKIIEKNKLFAKLESRYQDLVTQTTFIKKTFFTHLNSVTESKNVEIMNLRANYEGKLMNVEDLLSQERIRNDKLEKQVNNMLANSTSNTNALEEEIKNKNNQIQNFEAKLKDFNKLVNSYESENKNLKKEKENLKKMIEEMKLKENNMLVDLRVKDTKCDNLMNDFKNMEKQFDLQKKNINQLSDEIIVKVKEISSLKFTLESKLKIIEELEKALENSKINHIETLNEVHKANQSTIEKLNNKIDELTQSANEKFKFIEQIKFSNQELLEFNQKKDEEIKLLNNNLEASHSELKDLKEINEDLKLTNENFELENSILKKKMEEVQVNLTEKEKKLNELHEMTKFFYTNPNENNFFNNENNKTNANTELTDNINNNLTNNSLTMAITNLNLHNLTNLTKFMDLDEFINVKRLDKGIRAIFVPHSPGVYVSITLNPTHSQIDLTGLTGNFEMNNDNLGSNQHNFEVCKFFKCNSLLNIDALDPDLRELLMENSLIIIGKVNKLSDYCVTSDNNPYQLPEDNTYILVDLEKIDYVIGFQGEELIFRNYLF